MYAWLGTHVELAQERLHVCKRVLTTPVRPVTFRPLGERTLLFHQWLNPHKNQALYRSDTDFQVDAEQNSEKARWRTPPGITPSRGRLPAGFAVHSRPWVFLAHSYRASGLSVRCLCFGPFHPHLHSQWGKVCSS